MARHPAAPVNGSGAALPCGAGPSSTACLGRRPFLSLAAVQSLAAARVDASAYASRDTPTFVVQRFGREPGFHAVATVDAIHVLAQALARARPGESPRDAVLGHGRFVPVQ